MAAGGLMGVNLVLVREGKLKPGQFSPEDIATNKYNNASGLVQH